MYLGWLQWPGYYVADTWFTDGLIVTWLTQGSATCCIASPTRRCFELVLVGNPEMAASQLWLHDGNQHCSAAGAALPLHPGLEQLQATLKQMSVDDTMMPSCFKSKQLREQTSKVLVPSMNHWRASSV